LPPAFALASRTAALRSVAESEPLVPRTLLSRLREPTSQAKRLASGPTLAGAGVNGGATVIKADVVPERRSGLSMFAWCKNKRVRSSHYFSCSRGGDDLRQAARASGARGMPQPVRPIRPGVGAGGGLAGPPTGNASKRTSWPCSRSCRRMRSRPCMYAHTLYVIFWSSG